MTDIVATDSTNLSTPPTTPKSDFQSDGKPPFEYSIIVSTYHSLLSSDPLLTMPVAAIESLILLLSHSPSSTISETLSLLAHYTNILKSSVANPIALSAGTDLFQRYLISTLQSPQPGSNKSGRTTRGGGGGDTKDDFPAIRHHLISNGRLFAARAKEARSQIAHVARQFIQDGTTVLTYGSSRVVGAVLSAVLKLHTHFKLVYVCDTAGSATSTTDLPSTLPGPSPELPIAVIPSSAVAHALSQVSMVMLGAEGVVENGGIISGMGTYQLGVLAKAAGKPVYVCAESHKFVRIFPLSQADVGGGVLQFISESAEKGPGKGVGVVATDKKEEEEAEAAEEKKKKQSQIDYTPPELITALITESGVHTPSAVSEELIKIWY